MLPVDFEGKKDTNKESEHECDVEKRFHEMIEIKKEIVSKAHKNIMEAQTRYKKDFEKKHQQKEVNIS